MSTIIAESEGLKQTVASIDRIAQVDLPVLLVGETGVGRTSLARHLHAKSARSHGPFVVANMAAAPEADLLATIFGRTGTDHTSSQPGLAATANGGTLLLQNIEDLPDRAQAPILDLVQERLVRTLGGGNAVSVDCRIVATASPDLRDRLTQGRFRSDVYYRLSVLAIDVPPLRDRRDDVLPLARHFLEAVAPADKEFSVGAMELLLEYPWPGNVQQLRSVVTRAALVSKGRLIEDQGLALERLRPRPGADQIISHLRSELEEATRRLDIFAQRSIQATPIWEGKRFDNEDDLCFVLMPFSESNDVQRVYQDHVKQAVESCGLRCVRADDIYGVSGIMQSIWEAINRSRVVIAEMTNRNPNVFYELGIAHTLGKPVLMISQSLDDVPFDLKHLRCIVYDYKPKAIERLVEAMVNTLTTILRDDSTKGAL